MLNVNQIWGWRQQKTCRAQKENLAVTCNAHPSPCAVVLAPHPKAFGSPCSPSCQSPSEPVGHLSHTLPCVWSLLMLSTSGRPQGLLSVRLGSRRLCRCQGGDIQWGRLEDLDRGPPTGVLRQGPGRCQIHEQGSLLLLRDLRQLCQGHVT